MMGISKEQRETSNNKLEMLILGSVESKKVKDIPYDIFPLVITTTTANYYVSMVLIDGVSSYGIMFIKIFEKLKMKKEKLWPRDGSDLKPFNGTVVEHVILNTRMQ